MRCGSCLLGAVFSFTVHAVAAEPGAASTPPKSGVPAAPKPTPVPEAPKAGDAPPAEYYVEPATPAEVTAGAPAGAGTFPADSGALPPRSAAPPSGPPGPPPPPPADPSAGQIYEPQPPGFYPAGEPVFEPPPPPQPHHIAPRSALWLGARVGWFIPFGNAWSRGSVDGAGNLNQSGVPWRDYASSGPMFELDAGARLSRAYNVFAIWERAELGSGRGDTAAGIGKSSSGDTDFWGVGLRATSDPDRIGFLTELAVGYRRARVEYDGGAQVQFTQAPFEARLGLGAELRINRFLSLSPMATLGVGSFGKIERVASGNTTDAQGPNDDADGHAWATLTLGGSFDVFGTNR